jgi:hypothetical protein
MHLESARDEADSAWACAEFFRSGLLCGFQARMKTESKVIIRIEDAVRFSSDQSLGRVAFGKTLPATPANKRGGVILAQEGDRWIVTMNGYCGTIVPTDLAGFIEYAKTLPAPHIYDVISQAEPVGQPYAARFPASVRRRYEELDAFPEGYLVVGDAICSFNPVYGQGMSVAALEAFELDKVLKQRRTKLAQAFFARAGKVVDIPWSIAAGGDLGIPEVTGPRPLALRFLNWYIARLHVGARRDPKLAMAFHKVTNLLASPQSLFNPLLAMRVLSAIVPAVQPSPNYSTYMGETV